MLHFVPLVLEQFRPNINPELIDKIEVVILSYL